MPASCYRSKPKSESWSLLFRRYLKDWQPRPWNGEFFLLKSWVRADSLQVSHQLTTLMWCLLREHVRPLSSSPQWYSVKTPQQETVDPPQLCDHAAVKILWTQVHVLTISAPVRLIYQRLADLVTEMKNKNLSAAYSLNQHKNWLTGNKNTQLFRVCVPSACRTLPKMVYLV